MQLVVAEKPSVAQAISHVIGAKREKRGVIWRKRISRFMVCRTSGRAGTAGRCIQKHGKNGAMRACP